MMAGTWYRRNCYNMLDLPEAYRRMYLIRATERALVEHYSEGNMRCPTHLSIGQEAAAVGVALAARVGDHCWSTHRCHAHYLAWGGDLNAMMAELYGKATGCTGGWGGSMHLADEKVGLMGTSPIVGSSVAYAIGSAIAFQREGKGRVAWALMGDAVMETGQFWEAVNLAALWRLPIVFVCENNLYSTSTHINQRQPQWSALYQRAGSMLWAIHCQDRLEDVHAEAEKARYSAPAFLEIETYRFSAHVGPGTDEELGYRSRTELLQAHDRVSELAEVLRPSPDLVSGVRDRVREAFQFAEESPWPVKTW